MDKEDIVEVFYGSLWEASLLKSILEANDILSVINNTINSHHSYLPNGKTSVLVSSADADKAKMLVEQFNQNNGHEE